MNETHPLSINALAVNLNALDERANQLAATVPVELFEPGFDFRAKLFQSTNHQLQISLLLDLLLQLLGLCLKCL
jgi:hypothetical protein